jgi:hypothetical protein
MAARRLLMVMLVLLGLSTLAALLGPAQRARDRIATTETTEEPLPADTVPRGEQLAVTIEVGVMLTQKRVPIEVGDQLSLVVRSRARDQVEIPRLGLVEAVGPLSPARFDILAREPGDYAIRLVIANRTVGRISICNADGKGRCPG